MTTHSFSTTTFLVVDQVPDRLPALPESSIRSAKPQPHLPPWLARYQVQSKEEVDKEIKWLRYILREQGFSVDDIHEIVSTILSVSGGDMELAVGAVDFCRLFVNMEFSSQMNKDLLLAAVLHYTECAQARRQGLDADLLLFSAVQQPQLHQQVFALPPAEEDPAAAARVHLSPHVREIAKGAAALKRAEMISQAVQTLTPDQAASIRGLMLSVMDDWRSLAIGCVASLYRLEGILAHGAPEFLDRTPEMVKTAREALRVHAVLAEQLGMHRLKGRIED